ncbi:hypothetical protein Pmani_014081 [Petrolisthes manimaculis]|uniref:Regulatory protein zeste n=1 Tax=Petrolisthes manimaculis TaxID=1843537 RepID=A0AAE1UCY9_9EUCA|nr:hypothetical protein Pmani_014081 [Petrolisthes manimaculis]
MDSNSTTKRNSNWSKDETMLLLQLIKEKKKIIKGKFSPDLTIKDKREAWQYITNSLNATFPGIHRQREQVEKKWHNLLSKSKKSITTRRHLFNQTGGGPPAPGDGDADPIMEGIEKILGKDNVTVTGFQCKHPMDMSNILLGAAVPTTSNDVVELHVGEVGELPEATAPPEVADVRELMDFPPATRIDSATSAMINTGDPRAVASLIQDMREAYQAQRDAYQAQRETWKAIENYYKRKT